MKKDLDMPKFDRANEQRAWRELPAQDDTSEDEEETAGIGMDVNVMLGNVELPDPNMEIDSQVMDRQPSVRYLNALKSCRNVSEVVDLVRPPRGCVYM